MLTSHTLILWLSFWSVCDPKSGGHFGYQLQVLFHASDAVKIHILFVACDMQLV